MVNSAFIRHIHVPHPFGAARLCTSAILSICHRVKAPTHDELNTFVHTFSHRVARCLEKCGVLERDAANSWLTLEEEEDDVLTQLQGASVTYRIATGPQQES